MKKLTDKQRYINLMQKVNKVMINESVFDKNTSENILNSSFEKFLTNELTIMNTNTNVSGDESFVELKCVDDDGNEIVFTFKAIANELEQDGVFSVGEAQLVNFTYKASDNTENIEIDETGLRMFNQKYGSKLPNVISNYIDVEDQEPDDEESLYEEDKLYESAIKKIDSIGNMSHFNSLSPKSMEYYYDRAKAIIDNYMRTKGLTPPNEDNEGYIGAIWKIANDLSIEDQSVLNERRKAWVDGSQAVEVKPECKLGGKGDGTSKACNQGDIKNLNFSSISEEKDSGYPEPIAKEFSGGGDYPKTKKKHRITKKKIKEEDNFGVPGYSQISLPQDNIQEGVIPSGSKAVIYVGKYPYYLESMGDTTHFYMSNSPENNGLASHVGEHRGRPYYADVVTWLKGGENIDGKKYQSLDEFDDNTADTLLGYEPKNVGDNFDIDSIISQKEETSDVIDGGLADDKMPSDFNKKQLAKGIKVEMEHTNDPLVAIEIAMDHLMEDPEYYGSDDEDPEDMAQQHASIEASEFDDYKPINVGESIDEKFTVVFDGTSAYVLEPYEEIDSDCEVIGTYDHIDAAQRVADRYNDKAQGTQMTEEEEFEINSGDRFEDANGKQYTVNNMTNDKINIRSNDGKQQETTPDALRFTKKM